MTDSRIRPHRSFYSSVCKTFPHPLHLAFHTMHRPLSPVSRPDQRDARLPCRPARVAGRVWSAPSETVILSLSLGRSNPFCSNLGSSGSVRAVHWSFSDQPRSESSWRSFATRPTPCTLSRPAERRTVAGTTLNRGLAMYAWRLTHALVMIREAVRPAQLCERRRVTPSLAARAVDDDGCWSHPHLQSPFWPCTAATTPKLGTKSVTTGAGKR